MQVSSNGDTFVIPAHLRANYAPAEGETSARSTRRIVNAMQLQPAAPLSTVSINATRKIRNRIGMKI